MGCRLVQSSSVAVFHFSPMQLSWIPNYSDSSLYGTCSPLVVGPSVLASRWCFHLFQTILFASRCCRHVFPVGAALHLAAPMPPRHLASQVLIWRCRHPHGLFSMFSLALGHADTCERQGLGLIVDWRGALWTGRNGRVAEDAFFGVGW